MKYVTINFRSNGIQCDQTEFLVGMPSPTTYLSFIHNIKLKSNLTGKDEIVFGVRDFGYYPNVFQRIGNNTKMKQEPGVGSPLAPNTIKEIHTGYIEAAVMFSIDSNDSNETLMAIIKDTVLRLHFAGGCTEEVEVFVSENEKKNLYEMMPLFLIVDNLDPIANVDELLSKIYLEDEWENRSELTVRGYNFISDKKIENFKKEKYAEVCVGLVSFLTLTKDVIENGVKKWFFIETEKNITTKQK